ncbi:tetratricopeptide repeat protein [Roseospirillum parvum]|nr:tetratricopeptide repeat protein [Roseospirillum parvum]
MPTPPTSPPDPRLTRGLELHRQGRLAEAEAAYRALLAERPEDPDGLHFLGLAVLQGGRAAEAARLIGNAVELAPERPTFHFNLGQARLAVGRLADAAESFARALALQSPWPACAGMLGATLGRLGRAAEALAPLEAALAALPEAAPERPPLLAARAAALRLTGRPESAVAVARQALAQAPELADAHLALANALNDLGRLDEAEAATRTLLDRAPKRADAWTNLGNILAAQWRPAEAEAAYRQALALAPGQHDAHGNLLLALTYTPTTTAADLAAAAADWARAVAAPLARPRPAPRARRPGAPLRVGYLSPDFRRHSCGYFLQAPLAHHDPARVEVHALADVARPDAMTAELKALAPHWHDVAGLDDTALAERLAALGLDMVVDCAGHTRGNRLPVLARRPAPLLLTWLGFPATTGLAAFDGRVVDALTDPPGSEADHAEPLCRLEDGFLCYTPPADAPAPEADPAGPLTFGSFNNLAKVHDGVMETWAAILARVPDSRLLLKGRLPPEAPHVRARLARFGAILAAAGVDPGRLEAHDWIARAAQPLALYRRVHIGLDPFPYNGTTTTCEALWMGVPVVTLAGDRHAARVGASLLARVGLDHLIAADRAGYIERAVELAADRPALAALKAGLRDRMADSPLTDGAGFARRLESLYESLWRQHCGEP